jgi:predicted nuclease of predicted toxin-antitoxin system
MLRFYIDHNVQAAIVDGLRARGIDCLTCEDDGTTRADDADILQRATGLGRIVLSEDRDFLRIASSWMSSGRHFNGVVFGGQ